MAVYQGRRSSWLTIRLVDCFRQNDTYKYILYLWRKDAILAIPCTGLPIITTLAGKQLNSLILHGDIKCITVNG